MSVLENREGSQKLNIMQQDVNIHHEKCKFFCFGFTVFSSDFLLVWWVGLEITPFTRMLCKLTPE